MSDRIVNAVDGEQGEPVKPQFVERMGAQVMRRHCLDLLTPVERTLNDALQAVESAGASVELTNATVLIVKALDAVADIVEASPRPVEASYTPTPNAMHPLDKESRAALDASYLKDATRYVPAVESRVSIDAIEWLEAHARWLKRECDPQADTEYGYTQEILAAITAPSAEPHPDTRRLDWLAESQATVLCVEWQEWEVRERRFDANGVQQVAHGITPRHAIDAAIIANDTERNNG